MELYIYSNLTTHHSVSEYSILLETADESRVFPVSLRHVPKRQSVLVEGVMIMHHAKVQKEIYTIKKKKKNYNEKAKKTSENKTNRRTLQARLWRAIYFIYIYI